MPIGFARFMRGRTSSNKKDKCKDTWGFSNITWDSDSQNIERRLVVYNGYEIYDKYKDLNKFLNSISHKIEKIINSADTAGEFLILVHSRPRGMHNKISLNSSTINNKKIYILDSHPYEKNSLISSLAEAVKKNDRSKWIEPFDVLWSSCIKGESQEEINEILHLFLPLDIDMQAIKVLINEKKDLEQAEAYLKDMLTESTNYHKSILNNYGERFNKLLDQVENQENEKKVRAVLGMDGEKELKIKDLLERISGLKSDDIEKGFFNNSQNNQLKTEIISFHSWYKELAQTLTEL